MAGVLRVLFSWAPVPLVVGALAACASHAPRSPEPSPAVVSPRASSAVVSVDAWEFNGHTGKLIRTPWYRLFTTESNGLMLETMPEFLEEALEHYTTALGPLPRPEMKLDTFLMASRPQWAALTEQIMGSSARTYLRIERGGFAAGGRALLWSIGPRDTLAIAAHEGWHQYTQRTFREWLPPWLEEGIATYMEGFVPDPRDARRPIFSGWANVERFDQLRAAAGRKGLLPLSELLRVSPQRLINTSTDQTLTYYAQVWALVHFLMESENGSRRGALQTLVADAAYGRLETAVALKYGESAARRIVAARLGAPIFAAYFGEDLQALDAEYQAFVERIADGSRERVLAGRSPLN